jgi:hypothetical protein
MRKQNPGNTIAAFHELASEHFFEHVPVWSKNLAVEAAGI